MSCGVKNVVHVIICKGFCEEYVGENKHITEEDDRPSQPWTKIPNSSSAHIDYCNDHEPNFNEFSLYKINTDGIATRRRKENKCRQLLKPNSINLFDVT